MALKANAFTESLDSFLDEVVILRHYQFFSSWQLQESRNGITRTLEHVKSLGYKGIGSGGSALGIANIFDNGDVVMWAPVGGRVTKSSDLLRLSEEIERRFNASLMVSVHERAEDYFKRVYGLLLYQLRAEGSLRHRSEFHKSHPKWTSRSGTLDYFLAYSKHVCRRDCEPAFAEFEKKLDWKLVAINKWGICHSANYSRRLATVAMQSSTRKVKF